MLFSSVCFDDWCYKTENIDLFLFIVAAHKPSGYEERLPTALKEHSVRLYLVIIRECSDECNDGKTSPSIYIQTTDTQL